MKGYFLLWIKAALIRSLRTFAQTAAALIPAAITISEVDWGVVFGTAALAAVASLLTSLGGLPEVDLEASADHRNKEDEEDEIQDET